MKKRNAFTRWLSVLLVLAMMLSPVRAFATGEQVTVSFTLKGDSKHGDNGTVHTLVDGSLTTWVSKTEYTLPSGATVLDLLEAASADKGFTYTNSGNYISSINGLSDTSNGSRCGWMYTLNGSHPDLGVEEQKLQNGDVVVFHYTDDYLREYAAEPPATEPPVTEPPVTEPPVTQPPATELPTTEPPTTTPIEPEATQPTAQFAAVYQAVGDTLAGQSHTAGSEWVVIGLTRSSRNIDSQYDSLLVQYIKETIDENSRLHRVKSTENSRVILALTALGKDATNIEGYNLMAGLSSMEFIQKQGINGPIFALIALDSGNYAAPSGVTREDLIQVILDAQLDDGGWALSGENADSDVTAMALQALAPYYSTDAEVKSAVDEAVNTLSKMQNRDGGYSTGDTATSESTAQVVVALTALGINPDTDARFMKDGGSVIDALLRYYVTGGGFKHTADGTLNGVSTEQGYYALASYARFLDGKTSLYDMTDVLDLGGDVAVPSEPEETEPTVTVPSVTEHADADDDKGGFPWRITIVVVALAAGAAVVVVLYRKKNRR